LGNGKAKEIGKRQSEGKEDNPIPRENLANPKEKEKFKHPFGGPGVPRILVFPNFFWTQSSRPEKNWEILNFPSKPIGLGFKRNRKGSFPGKKIGLKNK